MTLLPSLALAALSLPLPQAQKPESPEPLLLQAARIYVTPEQVLENSAVLLRQGKVALLGDEIPADTKQRVKVKDFPASSTIIAGFLNGHDDLGHGKDLSERLDAFTPELLAADALDPFAEAIPQAARQGITAVAPEPSIFRQRSSSISSSSQSGCSSRKIE